MTPDEIVGSLLAAYVIYAQRCNPSEDVVRTLRETADRLERPN